jgi:hypothetical protein
MKSINQMERELKVWTKVAWVLLGLSTVGAISALALAIMSIW